jgi:hypothetical protein
VGVAQRRSLMTAGGGAGETGRERFKEFLTLASRR